MDSTLRVLKAACAQLEFDEIEVGSIKKLFLIQNDYYFAWLISFILDFKKIKF